MKLRQILIQYEIENNMAEAILFPKAESQVYILHLHLEAAGGSRISVLGSAQSV